MTLLTVARRIASCKAGKRQGIEEGFTLIELMVVLLIMGILMAVAVPSYLSLANSGKDKAAQSDLTNAMTAVETYFNANQYYSGINASYLQNVEPAFQWVSDGTPASVTNSQVGYEDWAAYQDVVAIYTWAPTGVCWLMAVNANGFTYPSDWGAPPGISYGYTLTPSAATCANGTVVWPTTHWQDSWPSPPAGR